VHYREVNRRTNARMFVIECLSRPFILKNGHYLSLLNEFVRQTRQARRVGP